MPRQNPYLSSHQLIDFMRCPYLYAKRRAGMIERKESPAFLIGQAAHCRILEGLDVLKSEFALGGPVNPSTGKPYGSTTKKFTEWQAKQGKPVLSYDQLDLIENMAEGVSLCEAATELSALRPGRRRRAGRVLRSALPDSNRLDPSAPGNR